MNVLAVMRRSLVLRLRWMVTRTMPFVGLGSVMRPDGSVVGGVAYEISARAPWHSRTLDAGVGRLRVPRSEALYWFLESGPGLELSVEGGRVLAFEVSAAPDASGWTRITAGRIVA